LENSRARNVPSGDRSHGTGHQRSRRAEAVEPGELAACGHGRRVDERTGTALAGRAELE
jgi:hypothetical protein